MKLQGRNISKDGEGDVTLIPEEPEDMWHAFNIISEGDAVRATTIRKVQNQSATGSSTSNRIRTTLTVVVENIDFDTTACMIRLKGKNIEENQYVKMHAYHTLEIELNRQFSVTKAHWDTIALERIDLACDPTKSADVAAVIMQEGIAHVCLITPSMTLVRAKIESYIPRKRHGFVTQHEKGLQKFYDNVMQAVLRHIDFEIVKCILICSPGFVKDKFYEFLFETAVQTENKILLENKAKFLLVHSSSGFKHSLKEVMQDPAIAHKISGTKAAGEVKALESFYTMLQNDPSKAFYGLKHIQKANEAQAVETLLISDKLFRCQDVALRKVYVGIVDDVRDACGEVIIFSSLHTTGEQLDQLTGIAAILRFPMPEIEDEEEDSDEESE